MFARLLFQLLRGSRGRLVVAFVALVSGAAVISALLNLDLDISRKLSQEFRTLGANIVIAPAYAGQLAGGASSAAPTLDESAVIPAVARSRTPSVVAVAPFLYLIAHVGDTPVVLAGTALDELPKLEPAWKIASRAGGNRVAVGASNPCIVGRNVAQRLRLALGDPLDLEYQDRKQSFSIAAILDSGGPEDNQIFAALPAVQRLAGLPGEIGLVQISVAGSPTVIAAYMNALAAALPQFEVRPIREVTEAEGDLLGRIRLLVVSMVLLILILTALCVLATMAALAMERRADVGLMKALGGSITRIVSLFLAEVGVLGAAGGLIGWAVGTVLAYWMGRRVFGAAISVRWEIFPITIVLMTLVAMAGAAPLRLLGRVKPAAILRGE